jgi:hypothetical protein
VSERARVGEEAGVYEHISVSWAGSSTSGRTQVYTVTANRGGEQLGVIRWFGRWHQYVFEPSGHTVYSAGCLRDLADFLDQARR